MSLESLPPEERLPIGKAFRQLIVFQIKLFVDAFRDLLFSPISVLAFLIDAITGPKIKNSLSTRLLRLGRKSDRVINLFGEYSDREEYTIDETLASVESLVQRELDKEETNTSFKNIRTASSDWFKNK